MNWTIVCQTAFDELKKHLTSIPLLVYPDLNKPYILYTNATDKAICACLTQPCGSSDSFLPDIKDEAPIYFLSHKLSETLTRWPATETEVCAVNFASQRFDHCLQNAVCVIRTDHKPLKKGKRKVQGVPQSQTAALPRPQEEEETDKSKQAQTKQTYEKH